MTATKEGSLPLNRERKTMKERPILFSAPMVQAILAGRKTQSRRTVKSKWFTLEMCETSKPPHLRYSEFNRNELGIYESGSGPFDPADAGCQRHAASFCPYGQVGDRLWVRETTWYRGEDGVTAYADGSLLTHPTALYGNKLVQADKAPDDNWPANYRDFGFKAVPSIHMPRRASRITLEIESVRVERLQSISEADAVDEGLEPAGKICGMEKPAYRFTGELGRLGQVTQYPTWAFQELWKQINGSESWEANPWVWALSFKVLK